MIYNLVFYIGITSANVWFKDQFSEYNHLARDAPRGTLQALWFDQTLDHDNQYSPKFKQKYYVNTRYYKPGGPAYVYVSGEWSLSEGAVLGGNVLQSAKENNGIVFALEHRYYGDSQPYEEWTTENLRHLSSLNGVKDAGNFIKNVINPITNMTFKDTKWIVAGGSYPGSLAAWIRQEYPNDVFIGWSSSGPVLAKEDFFEYDQVVASALGQQCASDINSIRQYMDDLFNNPQEFNDLKSEFSCSDVEDNIAFLAVYADTFAGVVQYNSPGSSPSIDSICSGLAAQDNLRGKLNHIIQQFKLYLKNNGQTCKESASLDAIKNVKVNNKDASRQWIYQCCQEYGYWQTAPKYGISTRSRRLTVDWSNDLYCSADIWGKKLGPPNNNFINTRFKNLNNFTPRTIWVNGDADPWSALSVTNVKNSTLDRPIYLIKKGSHAQDLRSDSSNDSPSLAETKKAIRADISRWLK
jgi:serine protease 16